MLKVSSGEVRRTVASLPEPYAENFTMRLG